MKYNPPERICHQCGKLFIIHVPGEYLYKRRDYRKGSETNGKTLWFCSRKCMTAFEEEYPRKEIARGFKNG